MIIIGFSYNFKKGKKYEEKEKALHNSDRDSGIFN
jgi:hypothetical protein